MDDQAVVRPQEGVRPECLAFVGERVLHEALARLAADSFFGWFFGPLVDLEAADAAVPAAERLWAELELADSQGNR